MAAEIGVRRMQEEDIPAILAIDQKVVGRDRTPSWPQRVSSHFRTYYPPLSYVAETDDGVVGFILGDIRGAEYALPLSGWIDIVGVDPDYQSRGIGRRLIEAFMQGCRTKGIKPRAIIREGDTRLQDFLSQMGFRRGELVEFVGD
ncbi:MAG: GNAT family N-acetyltransferase [Dehalococcoidia bacterium]